MKKEANAAGLLPILVFLIFYLGSGIYFEYINPVEGGMGFYVMSAVVAFMIGLAVAFAQNRELKFDDKISVCAKSIGDDNITTMLFIFLMAGAFSGTAQGAGGATSAANLLLSIVPPGFAIVGLFIIACVISMAMGTSCGTISVIVPVAMNVATGAGLNMQLCVAAVIGGAMFGDNLSFISDTTIAATKTQGCKMKDKFRENFPIALPAAILTIVILIVISIKGGAVDVGGFDYNIWQAIPYFGILVMAICGINVFIVLGTGIIAYFIVGIATGAAGVADTFSSMGTGVSEMFETMIVTVLVASMSGLIKENGGFEAILQRRTAGYRASYISNGHSYCKQYGCNSSCRSYCKECKRGIRSIASAYSFCNGYIQLRMAGNYTLRCSASHSGRYCGNIDNKHNPLSVLSVCTASERAAVHRI